MTISRHYVLAAGGTGGHMMPAYALAAELLQRGHYCALVTDERGRKIPGGDERMQVHLLPSGRVSRNPASWVGAAREIWRGRSMARRLNDTFRPSAIIGFGGYPALPALLGGFADEIPTLIHEQNAVLGRVNRLVARKVNAIATAYPEVKRLDPKFAEKVHLVGNPVRDEVLALRDEPFPPLSKEGIFRVLVTGGSQGAKILSDVVPDGLAMLPINLRQRLQVTQQCRPEDIERVRARYAEMEVPAELATYLPDLPERLGWAHLVIGRAGASSIAELTCAGRPAILVPFGAATDDHQTYNAKEMVAAGGARAIPQSRFVPKELAKQIQKMALEPGALENAARAARKCGRPDAVSDLADLVESFGPAPIVEPMKVGGTKRPAMGARPAMARDSVA